MTIPVVLIGLLIAMGIFTALGWSVAQAVRQSGQARWVHGAHAAFILIGMALVSLEYSLFARIAGVPLVIAASMAIVIEERWSRVFPAIGAAFGVALLFGLPFTGR